MAEVTDQQVFFGGHGRGVVGLNKVHVAVLDGDAVIASYGRNYGMLQTFEPFRQGDRTFALISPHYTATSVMHLRAGEIIAAQPAGARDDESRHSRAPTLTDSAAMKAAPTSPSMAHAWNRKRRWNPGSSCGRANTRAGQCRQETL